LLLCKLSGIPKFSSSRWLQGALLRSLLSFPWLSSVTSRRRGHLFFVCLGRGSLQVTSGGPIGDVCHSVAPRCRNGSSFQSLFALKYGHMRGWVTWFSVCCKTIDGTSRHRARIAMLPDSFWEFGDAFDFRNDLRIEIHSWNLFRTGKSGVEITMQKRGRLGPAFVYIRYWSCELRVTHELILGQTRRPDLKKKKN
jgi:hypothetical protein